MSIETNPLRRLLSRAGLILITAFLMDPSPVQGANPLLEEDYNQWKQALGTKSATPAESITRPAGFDVQLLRSAQRNEGSWVAMTFDPKGRVIVAREDRGLLRLTLSTNRQSVMAVEVINTNLLECRGLLFAHGALYANANNSKALVRLRDADGDDQFEEITVLRRTPGGVGHGRNQLALGPDGFIYSIHGDDVGLPTNGISASSPMRHYNEDRLIPCAWDRHLFNAESQMPFGHLIRTDADGKRWELVAGGLRNPFGIDFNAAGDLFTFDADMEWDVGLSWYHPTRVLHLVPGGDYGWRRGTGVLPVWSPDTLPAAVDIGVSSPTAIKFGTPSNWPEPWRSALFIQDWSYGKIIAVHLKRAGATYTGLAEAFLQGRPLNVTGMEFGPDGALYVVTGGRRTQSGLYRLSHAGAPAPAPRVQAAQGTLALRERSLDEIWTDLESNEHWVRYGARVELEARPLAEWKQRALKERRPNAALTALLALARTEPLLGTARRPAPIVARLLELSGTALDPEQQLIAIRAAAVNFIRAGRPEEETARRFIAKWEPRYPGADARVNQSLCELLVYLGATNVVSRTVPLLHSAKTQEEKFHYLFTLRTVTNGWTLEERKTYFESLGRARREFNGANMLPTALNYIRADAGATLTERERAGLKETLEAVDAAPPPAPAIQRQFVKEWVMSDFTNLARSATAKLDRRRGKALFNEAGCAQCHRVGTEGGFIGPDLTAVAARFDRRAILESIIEPSKVISDVYRSATVTMKSGAIHDGRIVAEDARTITIAINPVDPDQRRRINKSQIAGQRLSDISPMPAGLLNTLTREEVLELLAWLEAPGRGEK